MARILIVDDEPGIRSFLCEAAGLFGHHAESAADGIAAWQKLEHDNFDVLLTDLSMPGCNGLELLRTVQERRPHMASIVLTAHGSVASAVQAMKLGAIDYLEKPVGELSDLRALLDRAAEVAATRRKPARDQQAGSPPFAMSFGDPAMTAVEQMLLRVARTPANVLLLGESGVGKEKAAEFVHLASSRATGPFMAINCASLSETLLEGELFGHERGAFTGASHARAGRLEAATGGTFFLDEVGELRPNLQARLLRVIETRRYERVGGNAEHIADVRFVAATNRDLRQDVDRGAFRADLYHRLATFPVRIPPLRERAADIAPLARTLLARAAAEFEMPLPAISPGAMARLRAELWPGNVRELRNALERALVLGDGNTLEAHNFELGEQAMPAGIGQTTLEEQERDAIALVLRATQGNRRIAAERLGISVRALYYKLRRYRLEDIR